MGEANVTLARAAHGAGKGPARLAGLAHNTSARSRRSKQRRTIAGLTCLVQRCM